MSTFAEDWSTSQFWYTLTTATSLAAHLLANATSFTSIAFVSASSAFLTAKNLLATDPHWAHADLKPSLALLGFDERFTLFPEFVHYDYNIPTRLPSYTCGAFDCVLCDPPFLSEECQTKSALTARWVAKWWSAEEARVVMCTEERM